MGQCCVQVNSGLNKEKIDERDPRWFGKTERKKNIKSAKKVYKVIKWTKYKNGKLI